MNISFVSKVINYGNYRVCVAGLTHSYRYTIFGVNGETSIQDGYAKVIDAHRAALRQIASINAKHRKTP